MACLLIGLMKANSSIKYRVQSCVYDKTLWLDKFLLCQKTLAPALIGPSKQVGLCLTLYYKIHYTI